MSTPKDVTILQVFLGFTNYYGAYVPNMHNLKDTIKQSTKKSSKVEMPENF